VGARLDRHHDDGPELVLTFEELADAVKHAPPPTDDDVSITWDGRAIDTKEKLLAWLEEIEVHRAAGVTIDDIKAWRGDRWRQVDWDWDPVADRRA
jgi:hypothetical protein